MRLVPVEVPERVTAVDVGISAPRSAATSSVIAVVVRDIELRVAVGSDPAYVAALVRELGRC